MTTDRNTLVKIAALAATLPPSRVTVEWNEDSPADVLQWMREQGGVLRSYPLADGLVVDEVELELGSVTVRARTRRAATPDDAKNRVRLVLDGVAV